MATRTFIDQPKSPTAHMIERTALRRLRERTPSFDSVGCRFRRGVLFLRGYVLSYHDKQLATKCLRSVPGVESIINLTRVEGITEVKRPENHGRFPNVREALTNA